ncbi:MAG: hypothetical protein KIT87_11480 [Anaerolineae bacterium]|nr:hypothetical protein [Anaerolineae bacterium]
MPFYQETCDRCGHLLEPRQCREVCPRCGARLDCSDMPSVFRPPAEEGGRQTDD